MASYTKKILKNGQTRYSIQACIKNQFTGKNEYPNITWTNPDNLTGERAKKAAYAFGEAWEKEIRSGKPKSCLSTATFEEVANEWLNTRKRNMSDSYYIRAVEAIKRLNLFLKDKRFTEINARDVQQIFVALNNHVYEHVSAKVKDSAKDKFNEAALAYGMRKADSEGLVSRPVLYGARHGETINLTTAKKICERFGLNLYECFDIIHTKRHYRKESIMKYKRVLSCIFNYAIQVEIVNVNYASSAYLKKVIAGEDSKEIDILNEQEVGNLLDVLEKENIMYSIPIYLMVMLGLRCCEVCGLEFKDIDFEKNILTINRDRLYIPKKGIVTNKTKTSYSKRVLPVSELLLQKLKECKEQYDMLGKDDPEFKNSDAVYFKVDGSPANPQNVNKLLTKFLKKADCRQVSCHKLRHTFITRLISQGVPPNVVSKLAGHADCEITLKIYTHYNKDVDISKEVLNKIFALPQVATA